MCVGSKKGLVDGVNGGQGGKETVQSIYIHKRGSGKQGESLAKQYLSQQLGERARVLWS